MSYRKNCVWYDEVENSCWRFCHCYTGDKYGICLEECPKDCGNYVDRGISDENLRRIIRRKFTAAARYKVDMGEI